MATQSGSIDLKAAKKAHDDAEKVATNYLSVTSAGLWVLPSGIDGFSEVIDPTGNPAEQGWYELVDDEYEPTADTTVQTGKEYYQKDAQYSSGGKVLLANDGVYIYNESGILVGTFGENITLGSTLAQYIGNSSSYIVFDPTLNNGDGGIIIGGASIQLTGGPLEGIIAGKANNSDIPTKVSELINDNSFVGSTQLSESLREVTDSLGSQLSGLADTLDEATDNIEKLMRGIIADPNEPSVTVVNGPSQVKIKSESIELKGGANATTFITPNGMETTTLTTKEIHPRAVVQGQAVGPFHFLARENGHFSLKKAR